MEDLYTQTDKFSKEKQKKFLNITQTNIDYLSIKCALM